MIRCPLCNSYDWEVQELDFDTVELDEVDNLSIRGKCHCYSCRDTFEATLSYALREVDNPHTYPKEKRDE